jgi:hypothetical protein
MMWNDASKVHTKDFQLRVEIRMESKLFMPRFVYLGLESAADQTGDR